MTVSLPPCLIASMREKTKFIPLLLLIFITFWLRLVNLGYSDYTGDEIKAMWRPERNQSAIEFLYDQKKGPIEYLITYLVKFRNPSYSNELLLRLPFTLAGILGIFFFYALVELHFGKKIALYAAFLLSINGIFVGLMRVAQYQSFVILFSILTLYSFSLALQNRRWKYIGIYTGVVSWTAALLTHYDGIFIAPFALYLLYRWYSLNSNQPHQRRIKHIALPFALGALVLAIYFVPYLLSLTSSTKIYWAERIAGEGIPDIERSSSMLNFQIYNPILAVYVYLALGFLSLPKVKRTFPVILWFAFPWIVLEGVIFDPGTHIYTYLLPATILVAFGLETFEEILVKFLGITWGKRLSLAWLALLFGSLAFISHLIFVDHNPEYPFEKKRILFWTLGGPYGNYKTWLYGFPYYRDWEAIGEYVTSEKGKWYYYTNEYTNISNFYVRYGHSVANAGKYVYILHPQSFTGSDGVKEKASYWQTHYPPVKIFEIDGKVVAEVYEMPPGTLEEIREAGY